MMTKKMEKAWFKLVHYYKMQLLVMKPAEGAGQKKNNLYAEVVWDSAKPEAEPAASQLVWSGFEVGAQVRSGGRLTACAPAANPCRQAFVDNQGAGKDRLSWDPLTTLIAVRGAAAGSCAACADCDGVNAIDAATGQNAWVAGPAANQSYVLLKDAQAAGDAIDNLLCQRYAVDAQPH